MQKSENMKERNGGLRLQEPLPNPKFYSRGRIINIDLQGRKFSVDWVEIKRTLSPKVRSVEGAGPSTCWMNRRNTAWAWHNLYLYMKLRDRYTSHNTLEKIPKSTDLCTLSHEYSLQMALPRRQMNIHMRLYFLTEQFTFHSTCYSRSY